MKKTLVYFWKANYFLKTIDSGYIDFIYITGGIDAITNQNEAEGEGDGGGTGGFDVDQLLQSFTGKQQGGLTNLFETLSGSLSKKKIH